MPLIYRTGSLFDAPPGAVLVHSGNVMGVWGAGIAKVMAARFPRAALDYKDECQHKGRKLMGNFVFTREGGYGIATLVVSHGFGRYKDDADSILAATTTALSTLLEANPRGNFHSPCFNAGLFDVPWERTEQTLRALVERHKASWTVWMLAQGPRT